MGCGTCLEIGPGMGLAGEPINVEIRSTTSLRKHGGQGRAVHHGTDRFS
ncbi:MAG: hypothetical protein WAM11_07215 [Cyanobium sp.]